MPTTPPPSMTRARLRGPTGAIRSSSALSGSCGAAVGTLCSGRAISRTLVVVRRLGARSRSCVSVTSPMIDPSRSDNRVCRVTVAEHITLDEILDA